MAHILVRASLAPLQTFPLADRHAARCRLRRTYSITASIVSHVMFSTTKARCADLLACSSKVSPCYCFCQTAACNRSYSNQRWSGHTYPAGAVRCLIKNGCRTTVILSVSRENQISPRRIKIMVSCAGSRQLMLPGLDQSTLTTELGYSTLVF